MPERPHPIDAAQFDTSTTSPKDVSLGVNPESIERVNAKNERARQMVEQGFQSLVEELKQGKSEHLLRYLDFCARFHKYSPVNQMMIYTQRPDATYVAGFKS